MKKLLSIILAAVLSVSAWSVVSLIRDVPVEERTEAAQTVENIEEEVCSVYDGGQEAAQPTAPEAEEIKTAEEENTSAAPVEQTEAAVPETTEEETTAKPAKKTWKRAESVEAVKTEPVQSEPAQTEEQEEYEPVFNENSKTSYTLDLNGTDTVYVPGTSNITELDEDISYVNDTILVFFNENVSAFQKYNAIRSVDGKFVGYMPIIDRYQVKVGKGSIEQLQEKCAKLMENENVLYAASDISVKNEPDAAVEPVIPDDPWYWSTSSAVSYIDGWNESDPEGSNWHLEAVQALSAWAYNDYFHEIKVGIVDSGFEVQHEDLEGKISFPKKRFERTNVADNHGTHVAGIIGAIANNKVGVTGLCWNSKLVCVDWEPTSDQHWITDLRIYLGFINTVKAGAKVINFSLGSSGSFDYNNQNKLSVKMAMNNDARIYSLTMAKLLQKGYDFIVVQSAGNGSADNYAMDSFYNGSFCTINYKNALTCVGVSKKDVIDRIIIAGSVKNMGDATFMQSSYSNGGEQVDICAPGSSVFSTVKMKSGGYREMSGTSMAAPMLTGITAMTWSVNPKLTGAQVRDIVCSPDNTAYDAEDNDSTYHPLTNVYRVVNAKLSVEAAIRLSRELGDLPPETTEETTAETTTEQVIFVDPPAETTTTEDPAVDIGDVVGV